MNNGIRYGHVLDPSTGWPVVNAPRPVTVAADTCTEAGMTATLAMLQGQNAEAFLEQQDVTCWLSRQIRLVRFEILLKLAEQLR